MIDKSTGARGRDTAVGGGGGFGKIIVNVYQVLGCLRFVFWGFSFLEFVFLILSYRISSFLFFSFLFNFLA